jgi:carbon starvation protein CstA
VDLRRLRSGELLAGASAVGLLGVMFGDWFGGQSAFQTLTFVRVVLVVLILCALALVVLTASRTVAMACSTAVITIAVAAFTLLLLFYRVAINEPGTNGLVSVDAGAYLGLLLAFGVLAGAWRALADERTRAAASLEQTERVLAVRGAARKPPPARDPSRPSPRS